MKKWMIAVLSVILLLALCACSDGKTKNLNNNPNSVSDILAQGDSSEAVTDAPAPTQAESAVKAPSTDVDVDLTVMSSTMVYSEVQNMILSPDLYRGKSVRVSGGFAVAEQNDTRYYACMVRDAAACCSNGIEFQWQGEHSYPEDYPEQGAEITVLGKFNTYYEGDQMYIQLTDAQLSF